MPDKVTIMESTLDSLVENKKYSVIREIFLTMQPADIALLLEDEEPKTVLLLFRLLPKDLAADTFVEMDSDMQEQLITWFTDAELKAMMDEIYVDDAVDIVEEMPANVVKRILKQASPDKRKEINELLKYPDDSAGSIMTTEFVGLRPDMTASEAIEFIKRNGVDKETIYTCYIIDNIGKLIGYVTLKDLIMTKDDTKLVDLMGNEDIISVKTTDDQEKVATDLRKYDLTAIPVVDGEDRLVGIVTVDDAMDVIETETTEDIEKMNAIAPAGKSYLKMSPLEIWKARFPWLLFLMISATFTGVIISGFEEKLAASVVLTAFIPMLMDTGGNAGGQASITVIRAISLGEVEFSDYLKVIWKELRVSFLCALTLAAVNFAKITLVDKMLFGNTDITIPVTLVICLTLVCVIVMAKLIGCSLPIIAKKIGLDPAVVATPFLTTIVDALSLLVYFKIAVWILHL